MNLNIPKWVMVLNLLDEDMIQNQISKKTGITYSHVCKLVQLFEAIKIANVKKQGRVIVISLTVKGKKLQAVTKDLERQVQLFQEID